MYVQSLVRANSLFILMASQILSLAKESRFIASLSLRDLITSLVGVWMSIMKLLISLKAP